MALELFDRDLTVYQLHEDGSETLIEGREQVTEYEGIFGIEKGENPAWLDWENEKNLRTMRGELEESGANREAQLLYGDTDKYGIYQLKDTPELRDFHFAGTAELLKRGILSDDFKEIQPGNYNLVYAGELSDIHGQSQREKLNAVYEKFNIDHPANYRGHSLSVSDIVVLHENGENSAHFVDSFGFTQLPDFVKALEGVKEQDVQKAEPEETQDTSGHGVQKSEKENAPEYIYKIEANPQSDSMENRYFLQAYEAEGRGRAIPRDVLYVGTPEKCRELMERLESGEMTQGDVRELFTKEQETLQELEQPQEQKRYPAFYGHTLSYAMEHGEVDKYSDSRKIDRECKEAVEETIRQNFDGMHLNHDIVKPLAEQYGSERMAFVLANTILQESWDGRFSRDNKTWASEFPISEDIVHGIDMNHALIVSSHPAVRDGFIGMFRREVLERENELSAGQEKVTSGQDVNPSARKNDLKPEPEQAETEVTLTVAECSEFHNLGEFYENIPSVEEAVAIWKQIPPERIHGIPAIGVNIHTPGTDAFEDVGIDILSGKRIDLDILEYIPDIKGNPQAMEVIAELVAKLPEMEIDGRMSEEFEAKVWEKRMPDLTPAEQLAVEIDRFVYQYDTVQYHDNSCNMTENVAELAEDNGR